MSPAIDKKFYRYQIYHWFYKWKENWWNYSVAYINNISPGLNKFHIVREATKKIFFRKLFFLTKKSKKYTTTNKLEG